MRRTFIIGGSSAALIGLAIVFGLSGSPSAPGAGLQRLIAASAVAIAAVLLVRGRPRDIALVATSLCLGLAAAEAVCLLRERPQPTWNDHGLRRPRPYVGFGPVRPGAYRVENVASDGRVIFDVVTTIGDDLLRVTDAPRGEGAVAFFGDSFTFGAGVGDKDTITAAFADLTGRSVPVPNLSFSAWSPAQNLASLQHGLNAAELRHPRRFVLMTAPWHVERTACKVDYVRGTPRYRLVGGALVQRGACFEPGHFHQWLIGFALYRDLVEPSLATLTKADIDSYFAIVDGFVAAARDSYGVGTTILVTPAAEYAKARLGMEEGDYERRLAHSGADILVDALPQDDPRYKIPMDGHPTALANRLKARLVLDRLTQTTPSLMLPDGPASAATRRP